MQQDLQEALKQSLKDIHLPAEVGMWPLAPAWWLLIAALVVGLILTIVFIRRHRIANKYRKIALLALHQAYVQWQQDDDTSHYLQTVNTLLRRCTLHAQGDQSLAITSGKAWANALNGLAKQALTTATENALGTQCYQAAPDVDVELVNRDIVYWVKTHKAANIKTKEATDVTGAVNV